MKKVFTLICASVLLSACATGPMVTGSSIVLDKQQTASQGVNPDQVILHLAPPMKNYQAIAIVAASSIIGKYTNLAQLETELVEELRRQAAAVGANGVTQIRKEILVGQTLISTTSWGDPVHHNRKREHPPKTLSDAQLRIRDQSISSEYSVIYRGKAISVEE